MTDRTREQLATLLKMMVFFYVPVGILVMAGADGCCMRNGRVHAAGEVQTFEIVTDANSEVKMRVQAGDKIYRLDGILKGVEKASTVDVYRSGSDCSLNVLLCSRADGNRVEGCVPIPGIETETPDKNELGISK